MLRRFRTLQIGGRASRRHSSPCSMWCSCSSSSRATSASRRPDRTVATAATATSVDPDAAAVLAFLAESLMTMTQRLSILSCARFLCRCASARAPSSAARRPPRRRLRVRRAARRRTPTPTTSSGPTRFEREGVAKGEVRGPFTLPSQAYPGHAAHLLGLRAGAVRQGGPGQPDDLQRRPGVQEHGGRRPRPERPRQPDRSPRAAGDARRSSSTPAARPNSPSRRRRSGATGRRTGRPSTTRSTTNTRASSSTS